MFTLPPTDPFLFFLGPGLPLFLLFVYPPTNGSGVLFLLGLHFHCLLLFAYPPTNGSVFLPSHQWICFFPFCLGLVFLFCSFLFTLPPTDRSFYSLGCFFSSFFVGFRLPSYQVIRLFFLPRAGFSYLLPFAYPPTNGSGVFCACFSPRAGFPSFLRFVYSPTKHGSAQRPFPFWKVVFRGCTSMLGGHPRNLFPRGLRGTTWGGGPKDGFMSKGALTGKWPSHSLRSWNFKLSIFWKTNLVANKQFGLCLGQSTRSEVKLDDRFPCSGRWWSQSNPSNNFYMCKACDVHL